MKIVAMECGGATTALVAIEIWGDGAQLMGTALIEEPRALSRLVMAKFDEVLGNAGWKLEEVDGLAIGTGPGSWTSLRIGFSTFKTLSLTLKIPLVGVPTFDAIASAVYRAKLESLPRRKKSKSRDVKPQIVLTLLPCRPGEHYGKVFEMGEDNVAAVQGEWIASPKTHLDSAYCQCLSSEIDPPLLLCGEGAEAAAQFLEERNEEYELAQVAPEAVALEIALAGAGQIVSGEVDSALDIVPLYLAPSHAERNFAAKTGGVLVS